MPGEVEEIKKLIEQQGEAWHEYKKANDEIIAKKAEGKVVSDLEVKLEALGKKMDQVSETKEQLEELLKKMQRPGSDPKKDEELQVEVKGFNLAMVGMWQEKGKRIPNELSVEDYVAYKSGLDKVLRGENFENLKPEERKAMTAGSDVGGGYLLAQSSVGRIAQKVFDMSIMRQLAFVQKITTAKLEGISDTDEADAGWVGENDSRDDTDTPEVGSYEIEAKEIYAQPKISQKLIEDAGLDLEAWLEGKVSSKFARVEGDSFCNGNTPKRPRGLFTYTTAATGDDTRSWGVFEHIVSGANGDFHTTKFDPLYELIGALKEHYQQNAVFLTRREVRTKARKLKEANTDRYLWEPSLQVALPDMLMGYPVRIDQFVPALSTGTLSLAFGDFKEAYTIIDRIGISTLRDPYTSKGFVKFYTRKRVGGGAVNFEAAKFLKFST
ncbi:MAG: phage major capsid protein [Pseudomonadota bacterium]